MSNNITSMTYSVNTGDKIPAIGLGTWQSSPDKVKDAVVAALKAGYRHIDTASAYENEEGVGAGIKESGVPREQIWLTTKLFNPDHKRAPEALQASLDRLGVDYVDLYLIHWPCSTDPNDKSKHLADWDFVKTWREMQKLPKEKVRNIGVSNFARRHLEKLFADSEFKTTPAVNQIELHPGNPSPELVKYCWEKKIHVTGYSCLGSKDSPLYQNSTLLELAKAKGKTPQQVLLMWGLTKGWSVIPKSESPERVKANFDLDGWKLTPEEMKKIDDIPDRFKVCDDKWLPEGVKVFQEGDLA